MECLKATEVLSAAHDGEQIEPDEFAAAMEHCHHCTSCMQFRETLARLDGMIAPPAPTELVERIVATCASIGFEIAEERSALTAGLASAELPQSAALSGARQSWSGRWIALASAAAVMILVVGATSIALLGRAAPKATDELAGESAPLTEPYAAAPDSTMGTADDSAAMRSTTTASPPYIAIDSAVWILAGPATPEASLLTTVSSFSHSLEETGPPVTQYAYRITGDTTTLYVKSADGTYLEFTRVVRSLGRKPYGLVTGSTPLRYGEWPTLPVRFKTPTDADGSPTFQSFAKDDLGVDVHVPDAGSTAQGFSIAPGTGPDDPAAGNPNWTWWEPLP